MIRGISSTHNDPRIYVDNERFMQKVKNGSNDFFCFWPEVSTKYDLQFE